MKVVFYHFKALPVHGYGGLERILFWHMLELVRRGHTVVFLGPGESRLSQEGIELIPATRANWQSLIPRDADIIHLMFNHRVPGEIPTINTVQGHRPVGEKLVKNSVFVSRKHAELYGSPRFVHNGIDLREYPFEPSTKSWHDFLFLALASWPVKNLAHAVRACRSTGKHLHLAGGRWWGLSRFIHSYGIIGGKEKLGVIRSCDALLFPVRWHDPCPVAVIEAMSQGLPVIGSQYGSLPELISGEVGFTVSSYQGLLEKIRNPERTFDPETIRRYVEERFSIEQHTERYLALYKQVISGEELNPTEPTYLAGAAENLLHGQTHGFGGSSLPF